MTTSFMPVCSVVLVACLFPPRDSVGEVARLMQFEKKAVRDVKCGEANPHGNGPFKPVHAQTFV